VVPVRVEDADGNGACRVDLFGVPVRMRCAPGTRPGVAQACLRAHDLAIGAPGTPGLRTRIERAIYQGGHFRLDLASIDDATVRLHMSAPEPFTPPADGVLSIVARDGWVVPTGGA
jgi:iron(III) transport system ATP-binding protein